MRRRRYNVRDLLGHWVKPRSMREKMCPHACCRGKRVHPANFPVILPRQLLRKASDSELADHYGKYSGNGNARRQVIAELDRRDRVVANRQRAKDRAGTRKMDRQLEIEAAWLAAEKATRGHMLNSKGRARGINERTLFTGSEEQARRYASDELLAYWAQHGRPTRANRRQRDRSQLGMYGRVY